MPEFLQSLGPNLPWIINLFQFAIMAGLIWRIVGVLDHALARAQVAIAPTAPTAPTPVPSVAPVPKPTPAPTGAVDQGLVDFIKKEEGFRANAYWDYKQWTIGYGTRANSPTEVITQAEAEQRLHDEIAKANKLVTDKFGHGLPKGAEQALTDLTYNAGSGWETQSLGAAVAAAKWDTVKADILQYNHAGGQVNAGLTVRRETEVKWFDNPL